MGKNNPEVARLWRIKNREKINAQRRAYNALHPEKVKHQNEKYKFENPEKIKSLNKTYQQENKEKVNAGARRRRAENPEPTRERNRKWRQEHPERMQAARDKWLDKNLGYKKQKESEWRKANIDRVSIKGRKRYRAKGPEILAKTRVWQKANPHICKQIAATRRARLKGATVGDTKAIAAWEKEWRSKDSVECAYCRQSFHPSECDTDHVIPISRPEIGGVHALHNLVPACDWCNTSKGNRTLEEWNAVKLQHPLAS